MEYIFQLTLSGLELPTFQTGSQCSTENCGSLKVRFFIYVETGKRMPTHTQMEKPCKHTMVAFTGANVNANANVNAKVNANANVNAINELVPMP